jgi:hypothetical protein
MMAPTIRNAIRHTTKEGFPHLNFKNQAFIEAFSKANEMIEKATGKAVSEVAFSSRPKRQTATNDN